MLNPQYRITDAQIKAIADEVKRMIPMKYHVADILLFYSAVTDLCFMVATQHGNSVKDSAEALVSTVLAYAVQKGITPERMHEMVIETRMQSSEVTRDIQARTGTA